MAGRAALRDSRLIQTDTESKRERGLQAWPGVLGPGPGGKGADVMPESAPVSRPRTWLARVGWRRGGPIRLDEAPVGAPRT